MRGLLKGARGPVVDESHGGLAIDVGRGTSRSPVPR